MENNSINSNEKNMNYRLLMIQLQKAIASKFWIEAIMIEFAIIEDRLSSMLIHSGVNKKINGMAKKQERIKVILSSNDNILSNYINISVLDSLDKWRSDRNDIIHDLPNMSYNIDTLSSVAIEGELLVKLISNKASTYRRKKKNIK